MRPLSRFGTLYDGLKIAAPSGVVETSSETGSYRCVRCCPEEAARLIVTFTRGLVVIERVYQDKARMLSTADLLVALL